MSGVRLLSDHPMHVAPRFLQRPVASPVRRAVAFAIDVALLIVPTVAAAIGFALLSLYVFERPAWDAILSLKNGEAVTDEAKQERLGAIIPMFVHAEARGIPSEVEQWVEEGRTAEAAEALKDFNVTVDVSFFHEAPSEPVPPKTIVLSAANLIPGKARGAALFLIPALYFTVLTRRGRTIGKGLAGIEVVRLDGHRLSWFESFERFTAYLHIPASLFIGLIDLWHDPNRRLAHDRAAHTAVLRRR